MCVSAHARALMLQTIKRSIRFAEWNKCAWRERARDWAMSLMRVYVHRTTATTAPAKPHETKQNGNNNKKRTPKQQHIGRAHM